MKACAFPICRLCPLGLKYWQSPKFIEEIICLASWTVVSSFQSVSRFGVSVFSSAYKFFFFFFFFFGSLLKN